MNKCSECRTIFVEAKKDLEKLRKKKGKSNITKQKRLMEERVSESFFRQIFIHLVLNN